MQRAPEWREIRDEDNESTFHIKVSFDLDLENAVRQIIANKRKKDTGRKTEGIHLKAWLIQNKGWYNTQHATLAAHFFLQIYQ